MDIKKIIESLKGENELILFDSSTGEAGTPEQLNDTDRFFYDIHAEAAKALEKQISTKPIRVIVGKHDSTDGCPICNKEFWEKVNFCPNCGQTIDWSTDESEVSKDETE